MLRWGDWYLEEENRTSGEIKKALKTDGTKEGDRRGRAVPRALGGNRGG